MRVKKHHRRSSQTRRQLVFRYVRLIHDQFSHWMEENRVWLAGQDYAYWNKLLDLRNSIHRLFMNFSGELIQDIKHGHHIHMIASNSVKSVREHLKYKLRKRRGCAVCGMDRVHNNAHIIPSSEGGEWSLNNLLDLCANHHYLFDHRLLLEDEWEHIDFGKKSKEAQQYAKKIIEPQLKKYWKVLQELKLPDKSSIKSGWSDTYKKIHERQRGIVPYSEFVSKEILKENR
ncbi:MAG: hypothetical protein G01um101444_402, partial [Parcubacteria group bacterium Gr01-1014_44]